MTVRMANFTGDRARMMNDSSEKRSERVGDVTQLLQKSEPDREEILRVVYDELHAIAGKRMYAERAGHTLQATALVHEAYIRLIDEERVSWKGRGHFYAAATEAMELDCLCELVCWVGRLGGLLVVVVSGSVGCFGDGLARVVEWFCVCTCVGWVRVGCVGWLVGLSVGLFVG